MFDPMPLGRARAGAIEWGLEVRQDSAEGYCKGHSYCRGTTIVGAGTLVEPPNHRQITCKRKTIPNPPFRGALRPENVVLLLCFCVFICACVCFGGSVRVPAPTIMPPTIIMPSTSIQSFTVICSAGVRLPSRSRA